MSQWKINPTAHIELDFGPVLIIGTTKGAARIQIRDAERIEGLYRLASLKSGPLGAFVEQSLADNDPSVCALIDAGLLLSDSEVTLSPCLSNAAFALDTFAGMHEFALSKKSCVRDVVTVIDEVLPESMRYSINVWSRSLAYSRLDIDHSDAIDLHWSHTLSPCVQHVKATPFLRTFDALVRRNYPKKLTIMRTYVYAGQSNDTYHTHADSNESDDVTAIYYPARWEDHWGGDLVFYDDDEPRWAVAPRCNRLILFHGVHRHRIAPIAIAARAARCSIVLRYGIT